MTEQMKLLERAVGERLIIRRPGTKGLQLTRAGEIVMETCAEVFRSIEAGSARIDALRDLRETSISIGVGQHFGGYPLSSLYAAYQHMHPSVEVRTSVATSTQLLGCVRRGELDFGVVVGPVHDPDFAAATLASFDLVFAGPRDHPLRGETDVPFLAVARELLITYDESSLIRKLLGKIAAAQGTTLHPSWEVISEEGQLDAVASGLGIAFVPYYSAAPRLARGEIAPLNVVGFPVRMDWQIVSAATGLSNAASDFREHLLRQRDQIEAHTLVPH